MSKKKAKNDVHGKSWAQWSTDIYHARVMLFIGGREKMCDTAFDGLVGVDDPMSVENAKDFAFRLNDAFGKPMSGICGECLSVINDDGDRLWVIRLDEFKGAVEDIVVLSHECLHAAISILGHCGVQEDSPFEALCYLHEAIFKKFIIDALGR